MEPRDVILARLTEASHRMSRYAPAYRALPRRDFQTVYPLVQGYIRDRFLLTEEMCTSDKLLDLADISLRYMLELKRQGIDPGQISRSCSGASSVVSKKILLIKAMQDVFDFSITPQDFAEITTVTQLTEYICAHGRETSPEAISPAPCSPEALETLRQDFPALSQRVNGHRLIYLDNGATQQMPLPVMEAVRELELCRGNIHRGIHTVSTRCTDAYEQARQVCGEFLGVAPGQITFTAGTTDGINRIARSLAGKPGAVVVTQLEHHSNFVPWQQLCQRENSPFRVCPVLPDGQLDLTALDSLLTGDVRLLAITQCSNVTGTVPPLKEIISLAHSRGIPVLVDGAQGVCHSPQNLRELDCDYYVCSGHKLGGPFGIGLLYCKNPPAPSVYGGGMVERVGENETTFLPTLEAGTPNISGAVGLAAALKYRMNLPEDWQSHEAGLLSRLRERLSRLPGVRILSPEDAQGCLSFTMERISSFDAAALLDQLGFALRSGDHCAQPLHRALGIRDSLRVCPAYYNTPEEIDALSDALSDLLSPPASH